MNLLFEKVDKVCMYDIHLNLLRPGRWSVRSPWPCWLFNLSFYVLCLSYGGSISNIIVQENAPGLYVVLHYLGMIPGSENEVLRRLERTNMKRTAPMTGRAGDIC